ncbi:hypothetical protein JTE90_011825 [Oedothorax gibbosus]|uniref:Uncharacterized protein n=1 Tax=Oedothorax gibbosus TaxID=931172 RepID=A0AAV6VRV6_9ARAC|nr:hypothetical protein JTE90_011825 [Oedothorax gibbosus]
MKSLLTVRRLPYIMGWKYVILQEMSHSQRANGLLMEMVRIPSKCVFYYRCPEHANRYVLSIVFAFDKEEDVYHFAFSYPYSYSRLQKYLGGLEASDLPFLTREKIAETLITSFSSSPSFAGLFGFHRCLHLSRWAIFLRGASSDPLSPNVEGGKICDCGEY